MALAARTDVTNLGGTLVASAARDINIVSGSKTAQGSYSANWTDKGTFSRTENKFSSSFDNSTSVGSTFSGGTVLLAADRDVFIEGSKISGTQGVGITAGRDLTVIEGRNTQNVSAEFEQNKKGIGGMAGLLTGKPIIPSLPYGKNTSTGVEVQSDTASASQISSSQGGVLLSGGNSVYLQGVQVDAARDITIQGGNVVIQAATNLQSVNGTNSTRTKGIEPGQILWHDPSTGINAKKTTETTVEDSTLTRTTLNGANVSITATDTLALAGTTVNTPGALTLNADTLILGTQTTEHSTQTTSAGRDLAYQKTKDSGQSDQTTNYNQFNVGTLAVNANHIQAGLGARDSLEALGKQPGMQWVQQLTGDPNLNGKIDWQRVEEAHKRWDEGQQGLTPEGAAIVTLVTVYFTAGAASGWGAAAGDAAATAATGGGVAALGEGAFIAAGGVTVSGVVGGAVTAGITALASQAAVALINNQGDIGAALEDLGSSASVRNLLTAIVTGGVLGGLDLNPTGLPTGGAGAQPFMTQLGQNLQAGAARAVINTAINGGSLEEALRDGIKGAILDTVAAQSANAIGDLSVGNPLTGDPGVLNTFTNAVAHAIAGCAVGAARTDNAGGCAAGALGAAVGELAATAYGRQFDTVQFAAMISGIAVAIAGGDASQINLGSQAGANAAANNFLNHVDKAKLNKLRAAAQQDPASMTVADWANLVSLNRADQLSDGLLAQYRLGAAMSDGDKYNLGVYLANYAQVEGAPAAANLLQNGSPTANSSNYTYPYAGTAAQQTAYMNQLSGGTFSGTVSAYLGRTPSASEEDFNTALIATQQFWNTSPNTNALPSSQQMQQVNSLLDALRNSALAGAVYAGGTAAGADPQAVANATLIASALSDVVTAMVVSRTNLSPVLGQTTATAPTPRIISYTGEINTTGGSLSGKPTNISPKDDASTARSLTLENESAIKLSRNGYAVEQNPTVTGTTKKPDYRINGEIFDNYAPSTASVENISKVIQGKVDAGQADKIAVNLKDSSATIRQLQTQLANNPIAELKQMIVIDQFGRITLIKFGGR